MKKSTIIALFALIAVFATHAAQPMDFYARKAEEAIAEGRYRDALDYANQEITDYEKNPNGYLQAAVSFYFLNEPGRALSMLDKAIAKSKKDKIMAGDCYHHKYWLLNGLGDTVQALKTLDQGLKADGKNVDLLLARGSEMISRDKKASLKDLSKAKKLAPQDFRPYAYLASLYTAEKKFPEALVEIDKAIELDGSQSYSYALKGYILKDMGCSPEWIQACLKSYGLDGNNSVGYALLMQESDTDAREEIIREIENNRTQNNGLYPLESDLLYGWNDIERTLAVCNDMIKQGIGDADTYYRVAYCQERAESPLDAYLTACKGLDAYPDDVDLRYVKAHIGVLAGKGEEVLGDLDALIAKLPDVPDVYLEKGRAYLSLGRYAEAVEPLAAAILLRPSAVNKCKYADALRLSGNLAKANAEYNDILSMSPEQIAGENQLPDYIYAMAYSGLGNREKAMEGLYTLACEREGAGLGYMPTILARLGAKDEAIEALKKCYTAGLSNPFFDLYDYDYFNLHKEPAFRELLAENDIPTTLNEKTGRLELAPDLSEFSSGGTSIEDVKTALANNDPADYARLINDMCPIDLGLSGQLTSVALDEKTHTIIYNYLVNPGLFNFEMVNSDPSYKKKKQDIVALSMLQKNPGLADMGVTFRCNYKESGGSGQASLILSSTRMKELRRISKSQDETDRMLLDFWFDEDKTLIANDPSTPGATLDFDGRTWTYTMLYPEQDIAALELLGGDYKKYLAIGLQDPAMSRYLPVFVRQNITLKYVFKDKESGKSIELVFTPEEMSQIMNSLNK